jgi:ribosome-binding protein aMBF1 (putative translation factor)
MTEQAHEPGPDGMKRRRLAAILSVNESTVHGGERGRHRPTRGCETRLEEVLPLLTRRLGTTSF